ncbi:MAG: hypothetical protein LBD29_09700 [Treponema sp.]|jgi:ElaB/YqjD/DUF883 family membrane-anchored ribosome-binding protein|nr:hypothetical protein [Treponema sp.]
MRCAKKAVTQSFRQTKEARKHNSDLIQRLFDMVNSQAKKIVGLNATLKAKIQDRIKEIRDELEDLRPRRAGRFSHVIDGEIC